MKYDREIAVVFNPAMGDFSKKIREMRREQNRACEELEKMQELFEDHNLPWQFKERLYLADYLVENCDGYYQDIGISKRKIKGKDY